MNSIDTVTLEELSAKVPDEVWELIFHIEKTCGSYPVQLDNRNIYYGIEKIGEDRFLLVIRERGGI